MTSLCPSCGARRGKRACPALGREICAVCCGTKRQTEIDCPVSCVYLSSARSHPAAAILRRREADVRFFAPLLQDLSETQYRALLFFSGLVVRHSRGALPPLLDEDVAEAAAAVAATLETARKGIIYEHHAGSALAQRLARELTRAIEELSRQPGAPATLERDAAAALRTMEKGARTAGTALRGERAPVYIALLARMMATPPAEDPAVPDVNDSRQERPSGLIIPGR